MNEVIENSTINSALFTDFYELTMAHGYWKQNMDHEVVFDMFFRKNPFEGGFSVLAGVETFLDVLTSFTAYPGSDNRRHAFKSYKFSESYRHKNCTHMACK